MPIAKTLVAAVIATGLIAGCRADGETERQALIDRERQDCVDGFSRTKGGAAGLDGALICECAVGKLTEGKDMEQLRKMTQQPKASEADLQTMGACVVEEAQRKGMLNK
jgi:hypothetical protein